jgi:hypothetical protein
MGHDQLVEIFSQFLFGLCPPKAVPQYGYVLQFPCGAISGIGRDVGGCAVVNLVEPVPLKAVANAGVHRQKAQIGKVESQLEGIPRLRKRVGEA